MPPGLDIRVQPSPIGDGAGGLRHLCILEKGGKEIRRCKDVRLHDSDEVVVGDDWRRTHGSR